MMMAEVILLILFSASSVITRILVFRSPWRRERALSVVQERI